MATMHHSKNELKIKYEKLKHDRLLPGKIAFTALIVVSSIALLYWICDPKSLQGLIESCLELIIPIDTFIGGFLWVLLIPLLKISRFLVYILLVYIIFVSVSKLHNQNYGRMTDEEATLELAVNGEEKVLSVLSNLPDWCHVYTNVTVPWKDRQGKKKSSHLDIILVSPSRILAIKIKNLKGTICGNVSDQNLTQKTYRHGTIFREKTFYNPVKQVQTHACALSSYLKEHGLRHYVYTGVFFSNDDAEVDIRGETDLNADCPIFEASDANRFYTYFRAHNYRLLNDEEVQKVLLLLDQLVENPGS
ncbi:MAG: NERD domain-containing protein [Oscillospiraceae bacterium]|nr:NERD domain-containing protein [Oscillospiraceae bacterium]